MRNNSYIGRLENRTEENLGSRAKIQCDWQQEGKHSAGAESLFQIEIYPAALRKHRKKPP